MLSVEVDEAVAIVSLDRPDKLNALTIGFWTDIQQLLMDAQEDAEVRALVVHGSGGGFSVGGDIEGFGDLGDIAARRRYQELAVAAYRSFETFPKPTFVAVHGYALGGGCELTMVADVVVADATARFGMPESSVGLMPGIGVVRGHANTNLHWLKHLIFTGEHIGADEARLAGLVTQVTPEGGHLDEAVRQARLAAAKPAVALRVAKRILNRGSAEGYDYSVEAVALLHSTEDQHEGVQAFKERRAPTFRDR